MENYIETQKIKDDSGKYRNFILKSEKVKDTKIIKQLTIKYNASIDDIKFLVEQANMKKYVILKLTLNTVLDSGNKADIIKELAKLNIKHLEVSYGNQCFINCKNFNTFYDEFLLKNKVDKYTFGAVAFNEKYLSKIYKGLYNNKITSDISIDHDYLGFQSTLQPYDIKEANRKLSILRVKQLKENVQQKEAERITSMMLTHPKGKILPMKLPNEIYGKTLEFLSPNANQGVIKALIGNNKYDPQLPVNSNLIYKKVKDITKFNDKKLKENGKEKKIKIRNNISKY